MAKESVVSVLEVLFDSEGGVTAAMSTLSAASLLVFSLLYTPCVAAIASIKRELGRRWAVYVVLWQCGIAWAAALLVRLIGLVCGMAWYSGLHAGLPKPCPAVFLLIQCVAEFDAAVNLPCDDSREAEQQIGRAEGACQAADQADDHHSNTHKGIPLFPVVFCSYCYYREWKGRGK